MINSCTYKHNPEATSSWTGISTQWCEHASQKIKYQRRAGMVFIKSHGLSKQHAVNPAFTLPCNHLKWRECVSNLIFNAYLPPWYVKYKWGLVRHRGVILYTVLSFFKNLTRNEAAVWFLWVCVLFLCLFHVPFFFLRSELNFKLLA